MSENLVDKLSMEWFGNKAKKMEAMVDSILLKFPTITDHTDFYSMAEEVFCDIAPKWDSSKGDFKALFYSAVRNKTMSEMTARNCSKRAIRNADGSIVSDASIYELIGNEEGSTIGDCLKAEKTVEDEVFNDDLSNLEEYYNSLTMTERKVLDRIVEGYKPRDICKKLGITLSVYEDTLKSIRSYRKVRLLGYKSSTKCVMENIKSKSKSDEGDKKMSAGTNEKYVRDKVTVGNLIEGMNDGSLNYDNDVQRSDSQWSTKMKGELIYTILSNDPISELYFAERTVDGEISIDNIDGKQRSTTVNEFSCDLFSIPKSITRYMVSYSHVCKDENGKIIRKENGMPLKENRTCDIRKKKFSDFPKELQDAFMRYTFGYVKYINCSDEDIAYYICKHNDGKQMNPSQKGMGKLGIRLAGKIKEISSGDFFINYGNFTNAEHRNGTLQRVVIEAIMMIFFQNEWKKGFEEHCKFLSDNLTDSQIDKTSEVFEHLGKIASMRREAGSNDNSDDNLVGDYLTSKDTFLWAKLYSMSKDKVSDEDFGKFIVKFYDEYADMEINGTTFAEINKSSTKSRTLILEKIDIMDNYLRKFLNMPVEEAKEEISENETENNVCIEDGNNSEFISAFRKDDYINNSFKFSDSELSKIYHGISEGKEKELDDKMYVVGCLADYTVGINKKITADMFIALYKGVEYAIECDIDDVMIVKWVESFISEDDLSDPVGNLTGFVSGNAA